MIDPHEAHRDALHIDRVRRPVDEGGQVAGPEQATCFSIGKRQRSRCTSLSPLVLGFALGTIGSAR
jgi:hypothetical protein